jgi:[FeFe] hydrogenase H-cluster maturation GTPase HydF
MNKKGKDISPHIGIYGRRNNGKSSLINSILEQEIAIVSNIAGTTTDLVKKSFEITGFGPVILIDTAGIDDIGELGNKRIAKTIESIKQIDLAILVIENNIFEKFEIELINQFKSQDVEFLIINNKSDLSEINDKTKEKIKKFYYEEVINISAKTSFNRDKLIQLIKNKIPEQSYKNPSLLGDIISYGDIVLLITPIDVEAPEGRLILPQVQAIRDILDNDAVAIVLKEREVDSFLRNTKIKPALAITDSQIFLKADASIPNDIPLTSFSTILAKHKGDFQEYLKGTPKISDLKDGDKVLMLESCSHHVSCDDIGRVKIPRWISNFTGKKLHFDVVAGLDKIETDIDEYSLIIQCGGCVVTRKQLHSRLKNAKNKNIPITNYGMTIAYVQGIYNRAIAPFVGTKSYSEDYL